MSVWQGQRSDSQFKTIMWPMHSLQIVTYLGSLREADQATWVVSSTLHALHPCHQMAGMLHVKQRSPQESQSAQHRAQFASGAAALGWPHFKDGRHNACPKQSFSVSSKKESIMVVFQKSITKTHWRDSLHRRETAISHGNRKPLTETVGAHQWEKPVRGLRQSGMKPQRKEVGSRKRGQHFNHPQPKPSPVQIAVASAHQEPDSTSTKGHARTDHQPSYIPFCEESAINIMILKADDVGQIFRSVDAVAATCLVALPWWWSWLFEYLV